MQLEEAAGSAGEALPPIAGAFGFQVPAPVRALAISSAPLPLPLLPSGTPGLPRPVSALPCPKQRRHR